MDNDNDNRSCLHWLRRLLSTWKGLPEEQRGQSLIIVVFAFIGLLALVGLGVDLGLVYVERVRINRAADAAALAAASELPLESAAHLRALAYLQDNGYNFQFESTEFYANTYHSGIYTPTVESDAKTVIWIDTEYSQDHTADDPANTANRIRVRVRRQVPMTFLQFVGFKSFPVEAAAEAANVNRIDTVIVYDESGSMEYNTICYGCWALKGDDGCNPSDPEADSCIYPLPWSDSSTTEGDHCAGWDSDSGYDCGSYGSSDYSGYETNNCNYRYDYGSGYYYYTVIEAEEYSYTHPDYEGASFHQTFWAIQRNVYNDEESECVEAIGRENRPPDPDHTCSPRGAYISHHPFVFNGTDELDEYPGTRCRSDAISDADSCDEDPNDGKERRCCNKNHKLLEKLVAPVVEYDFYAPVADTYYVWIRGQGGENNSNNHIFWAIDDDEPATKDGFDYGVGYDGARSNNWSWEELGSSALSAGSSHTLRLWGGGAGFDVDRIIITTSDNEPSSTMKWADPNNGRTRNACALCDPRFAGRPGGSCWDGDDNEWCKPGDSGCNCSGQYRPDCATDMRNDELYKGEQPIYGALQAAKYFVGMMNPHFDQVGYVSYSGSASIRNQLECLRQRGVEDLDAPCDPEVCDSDLGDSACEACGCIERVITNTVLYQLDHTYAGGSTDIAEGIIDGHSVLKTDGPCDTDVSNPRHCGRPGAAHVMVLMTDGRANATPGDECWEGNNAYLWPEGESKAHDPNKNDSENKAADCVVYYALQARNDGIVIYTLTLGNGADQELMNYVAELTGGEHFHAADPDQLRERFGDLYKRIFLRLVE